MSDLRFFQRMTADPDLACQTWEDGELLLHEVIRQEYGGNNCIFSAGIVEGHPVDTIFLRLVKDGREPTVLLLRPDEAAALAWCLTGVLWTDHIEKLMEKDVQHEPEN